MMVKVWMLFVVFVLVIGGVVVFCVFLGVEYGYLQEGFVVFCVGEMFDVVVLWFVGGKFRDGCLEFVFGMDLYLFLFVVVVFEWVESFFVFEIWMYVWFFL